LETARRNAQPAPGCTHAVQVPSHIFTWIDAWDCSIASKQRHALLAIQAGPV